MSFIASLFLVGLPLSALLHVLLLAAWFYAPPRTLLALYRRCLRAPYVNKCVWYKEDEVRPRVALTIDDSPDVSTRHILDCLDRHQARATFFVIGRCAKTGYFALRELASYRQHEVGNHGWTRWAAAWYSGHRLCYHLRKTRALFVGAFVAAGRSLVVRSQVPGEGVGDWFRPGSGILTRGIMYAADTENCRVVLGDVYPLDAHVPWPWLNAQYVLRHVRPGSVIILHDRARTVQTLEIVLPELKRRGYEICTLSDLFGKQ